MRPADGTLAPLLYHLDDYGARPALLQMRGSNADVCSYTQLHEDAGRYASGVLRAGVGKGEAVGLFARGGREWITACLGLIRAGVVPVPLDVQADRPALEHILADCGARWILTDRERLGMLEAAAYRGKALLLDAGDADERSWRQWQAAEAAPPPEPAPQDTAILFYTSGTTGPPKGVPLRHAQLAYQLGAVAAARLVRPDERVLQPLPLHHVYPLVVGTLAPLALGLAIVLPESMMGPQLLAAIREQHVSFIIGVPRLYAALLDGIHRRLADTPGAAGRLMRGALRASTWLRRRAGLRLGRWLLYPLHRRLGPGLRVLASGGSALEPALAWQLEGLGWRVAVGYGLTETSPLLTLNPPGNRRLESVGRPVPGTDVRVEAQRGPGDDEALFLEGELVVRGPGVFGGYLGHAGDADSFTADGWFRTGDLGRVDDAGYVFVTGRRNTMIVTSAGKNIQPEELEEHYVRHPFIEEIGILGGAEGLSAVIVPAADEIRRQQISSQHAIRRALAESARDLASYKRIAHYVISAEPLARTRLGKIQRHRLKQRYAELFEAPVSDVGTEPPKPVAIEELSEADRALLEHDAARRVWALLTHRYSDRRVSPDTNVQLDLNVDSLGWLELSAEIAQATGVTLDERRIVSIYTVRDLLQTIADMPHSETEGVRGGAPLDDPEAALSAEQKHWLAPLPRTARPLSRALLALNRAIMKGAFNLRTDGLEQLDPNVQVLITPNHTSFLDAPVIAAALPRAVLEKTYWGGWTGYAFRNVLFRSVSRLSRVVPIDPDRAASSSLAFAAAILERGHNLVWFPEGERSLDGELLEFRPGLGLLLERFPDTMLLPAHIAGAYEAWPRERRWPRLAPIRVTFGAPVRAAALAETGRGDSARSRILNGLHDAMRALRG
jgi:long-chain acyl-CoA synthetase